MSQLDMIGPYVIAVDFDGTLFKDCWPGIGAPIKRNIKRAKKAQARGAKLVLNTCRVGEPLRAAVEACAAQDLHFDAINENLPARIALYGADSRKISADEYWDDKAVVMR